MPKVVKTVQTITSPDVPISTLCKAVPEIIAEPEFYSTCTAIPSCENPLIQKNMFRGKPIKYMSTLQSNSKTSIHNLRTRPPCHQLNLTETQIATLVHVTTIQPSKPSQSSAVRMTYRHPTAHKTEQKTYDFDVGFTEDDGEDADVCWRFQITEGEDMLERLLQYAQAFGKHGSGDDGFDEYVLAFQRKITGLAVKEMMVKRGCVIQKRGEYEVYFEAAEKARAGDVVEEDGVEE